MEHGYKYKNFFSIKMEKLLEKKLLSTIMKIGIKIPRHQLKKQEEI
jgi:hypothetical protein